MRRGGHSLRLLVLGDPLGWEEGVVLKPAGSTPAESTHRGSLARGPFGVVVVAVGLEPNDLLPLGLSSVKPL